MPTRSAEPSAKMPSAIAASAIRPVTMTGTSTTFLMAAAAAALNAGSLYQGLT